jgi:4-hydroxy-2-oxoheptanedioate aldolase
MNHCDMDTEMKLPNLRKRIHDRSTPPLVVVPVTLPEPAIVEIIGFAGAEAVLLEAEHGTLCAETMRSMLAHARSGGMVGVFRPRSFDAALCRQALDAGAAGIHVSHVDTEAEAHAVVEACRYPPLGRREMSLGRAIHYDAASISSYVSQANDCQLLVVMIESTEALNNADEIAAVEGIDVLHIGTADLAHSMGLPVYPQPREVREAVEHVLGVAERHQVAVGYPSGDPVDGAHWAARGVRYFEADAPDFLLRQVYSERLAALNAAFAEVRSQ